MIQKIKEAKNPVLMQEALFLFDQGVKTVLSDATTGRVISPNTIYSPIIRRDDLVEMCEKHATANLDIVADKKNGVVALGVGVGPGKDNWGSSFLTLTGKHGSPDTLAYQLPDGSKYYLFRRDMEEPEFDEQSGLRFLNDSDRVYSYPSMIDGHPVERVGDTRAIRSLSAWLEVPHQEQNENIETAIVAVEATAQEDESLGDEVVDRAKPMDAAAQEARMPGNEVVGDAEAEKLPNPAVTVEEKVPVSLGDPSTALRQEITSWVAGGSNKDEVLAKALGWNRLQAVPVTVEDVISMVEELGKTAPIEVETLAGEELLFKLAEGTFLFHDGLNDPYFHCEGVPFKAPSKDYEGQLQYRYYQKTKQMPKQKDLNTVLNVLKSRALYEGPQVNLKNRVSDKDGEIIYDLNDKRYLKVNVQGWEIVPAFPLFYRHKHQQMQLEPVAGGDPWKVFDVLHIAEENRLLLMVYLISLFVPKIAHPVLAVFGDQGSAKSFFCTVINRLVDPTLTEKIIQPKNERDLIQTLRQKYVSVLDNLSNIDNRVSDIFCQVCTGASISYRQLYTDQGENIAQFRHVVIVNSISLAIVNADLMDRSIILKCNRISQEDRKPEDELWEAFEAARPGILGGIFDTLVKAMAIYPTIKIEKLPRLADFAKWGYAIAEALGHSGNQFIEDFSQNVKRQNESVAEKNVLCQAVLQLMSDKEVFHKSVSDAHIALKNIAREDAKDVTFPKLPHLLRKGLEILRSTLAEHGITYQYIEQRESSGIKVLFSKTAAPATLLTFGSDPTSPEIAIDVPDVADVPEGPIPVVEFDEMPGGING